MRFDNHTLLVRLLALPLLLVMVFALAAACGGNDDDSGGNGDDSSQDGGAEGNGGSSDGDGDDNDDGSSDGDDNGDDADSDGGTDDEGSNDDSSDGDGSSGSGGGEGGLSRLRQAADSLDSDTYHVVYDMSGPGMEGQFTFASKPPQSLFALEGTFEGEPASMMLINDGEATYMCADFEGDPQCLKFGSGDTSAIPFELPTTFETDELADNILNEDGTTATPAGSQTIAGIEADCWDVTSSSGEGTFCVGNNLLLLMDGTFDGETFRFEAREATTDVGSIEITVPDYPVTDLGNLGG